MSLKAMSHVYHYVNSTDLPFQFIAISYILIQRKIHVGKGVLIHFLHLGACFTHWRDDCSDGSTSSYRNASNSCVS